MATEQEKIRDRLRRKLNVEIPQLLRNDLYFEGKQPLRFIIPALKDEMGDRLTELTIEFPRVGVFAYDDRLDITGFRFPGDDEDDETLWDAYLDNDGPFVGQQIRQEALALGRAYAIVGPGDGGTPLMTAESPFDCIHEIDPRTRNVANGIKQWTGLEGDRFVTLYQPGGRTTWYRPKRGGAWRIDTEVETDFGIPSIVPYINQPRMLGRASTSRSKFDQRLGRSEFAGIIPLADAVNKMATDMMISAEFHAMPRRYAFGLKADDFIDANGNPINVWEVLAGRLWAHEDKDVKVGTFPEADLANFHNSIKLLDQLIVQQLALPPHYGPASGDANPSSADAIRSAEVQLVKRSERKQVAFGTSDERVQRLMLMEMGRQADADAAKRIEVRWRDAGTPTMGQQADATVKLVTARDGRGRSIVPVEQAREDLGYSSEARKRMADYDNAEDPQIAAAVRDVRSLGGNGGGGGA